MTETQTESATVEWTYRDVLCRLYQVQLPDSERWIGYAKFGDEWIEAIDSETVREKSAIDMVESVVDRKIRSLQTDENSGDDSDDQFVPIPMDYPDHERPNDPWKPKWVVRSPLDIDSSGTWRNEWRNCEDCREKSQGLTWFGNNPPKCPKHSDSGQSTYVGADFGF